MQVLRVGLAPIKGTRHTAYDVVEVDRDGFVEDRELCLVDLAARRVLRTVEHPTLLGVLAERHAGGLRLTLPSGETVDGPLRPGSDTVTCDYWGRSVELRLLEGPHAALAAAYLGVPVRLALAAPGEVVYGAAVSLVATASVDDLARRLPGGGDPLDAARFRANLVVTTDVAWAEDVWPGREVEVGSAVLRVTGRIPRCAVVDLDPATGHPDLPVLRALAALAPTRAAAVPEDRSSAVRDDRLTFGVEATVLHPGLIRPGDPVRVPSG